MSDSFAAVAGSFTIERIFLEAAALQHCPQHPDQSHLCWRLCLWPHNEPGGRRGRPQARQARFAAPTVGLGGAAQGSARRLYQLERVREDADTLYNALVKAGERGHILAS